MAADVQHSGYWYGDDEDARRQRAVDVLQAFREYRAAEVAMRRRTRDSMSMGENDLLVLRYLLRAEREHRLVPRVSSRATSGSRPRP